MAPDLDAPLLDDTRGIPSRPLPPALSEARAAVVAAARDLLAVPESSLTRTWSWTGASDDPVDVRYGAYRALELLESGEREARWATANAWVDATEAARIVAAATAARWDLHGSNLPLEVAELDADPGDEQWPIRTVLGHVINGQRAYAWATGWWLANPHAISSPDLPAGVPDSVWEALPEDEDAAPGLVDDIRAALDAILDLSAERLAGMPDAALEQGSRWSGYPVTVGFRLGRWSSHIREHTIQVEKTLTMLGRAPTEPERLARLLLATYGRAESAVFGLGGADEGAQALVVRAKEARAAIADATAAASA